MMAELSVGRHAQKDPLGAYRDLSDKSVLWSLAGWLVFNYTVYDCNILYGYYRLVVRFCL